MTFTPNSFQKNHFVCGQRINLVLILCFAISFHQSSQGEHIDISWNSGAFVEDWSDAGNWLPNQIPGIFNTVLIGDLPVADNANVWLDVDASIGALTITDGMRLHTRGFETYVEGNTVVSGLNELFPGLVPSGLRVLQGPAAVDFSTNGLAVSDGADIDLVGGAWLNVGGRFTVDESSTIRGNGVIYLEKDGPILSAFSLNGRLQLSSGVMEIFQAGTSLIDLDGSGGTGEILIIDSLSAPNVLTVSGAELNDAFDSKMEIFGDSRINMNLANGWTLGENGQIVLGGFGELAVIEGSELAYRGELQVFGGMIESDVTFYDTASVGFYGDSILLLEGNTTFAGALFGERIGSVPLLIQNGDLTVTQDTTLNIPSGIFDWDGEDGDTITTIEPGVSFTINASAIDTMGGSGGGVYDGETNVGVGGELVVNTSATWVINSLPGTVIRLDQATLEGSRVRNWAVIQGSGRVSPAGLDNRGTLRSFGGGLLAIGPNQGETGGLVGILPVDGIDALENGVINYGFDLDGATEDGVLVATDGNLRVDAFQGNFVFDGTLNIGFGYEYLMNTGGLHNRGTITITGGGEYRADLIQAGQMIVSLGVLDDAVIVSDNAVFDSLGSNTLLADLYLQGNVVVQEGAQFDGDSSLINMSGSILTAENGAFIDVAVENLGRLDLDTIVAKVGVLAFENYDTGTLVIDLASNGGVAGFDLDQLVVAGLADLAGTLDVNLLDGFIPTSGDEFIVLTAADGVLGTFDTYDLPVLTGDDAWFVRYEPNEVVLLVTSVPVPEPSTLLLGMFGVLGVPLSGCFRIGQRKRCDVGGHRISTKREWKRERKTNFHFTTC